VEKQKWKKMEKRIRRSGVISVDVERCEEQWKD
jgi:hypothetical protein